MGTIKTSLLTALIFSLAFPLFAQELIATVDFGEIAQEDILTESITLERVIKNIVIPCECIQTKITSSYGESPTLIQVQLNPYGYSGQINQKLILVDGESNLLTLSVKAYVQ